MIQIVNSIYQPLFRDRKRYKILMGGRGAGRSTAGSQYTLAKLKAPEYFRCAIMRFVAGDIRNSIFQDIIDRAEEQHELDLLAIRENTLTIQYGANRINGIGFRKSSGDQKAKLKSLASYNTVVIEEADEVAEEDFMQLDDSLRTVKADVELILLLNPPDKDHWIIRRWFNLLPADVEGFYRPELRADAQADTLHIFGTYLDNAANLNNSTKLNYERYKQTRPDYYWNMIRGLVSDGRRGRIFKTWLPITDAEFEALPYPSEFGLDFGFTNHPAALIETKEHNDTIWVRQWIYQTGLINKALSEEMFRLGVPEDAVIYADEAEPKSIAELCSYGWNVLPGEKGKDSVEAGVDYLLGKEVFYTENSTDVRKETENYVWALDKNKNPTNKPKDENNHAMDAIRYARFRKKVFIGFA